MTGQRVQQRVSNSAGLVLAVASAAAFGTSGALAASLMAAGWTPGAAVTVRVLLAAAVLALPVLPQLRANRHRLRSGAKSMTLYGVAAVAGAQLCYFMAVQHLSVAVALLLEYSGALLVVLWMWARAGERPRRLTVAGGLLAVAGLVLVLDLAGSFEMSLVGVAWGVAAAVGLATYFVLSAGVKDALPPLVVAWGGLTIGGAALLIAALVGVLPFAASTNDVVILDSRVSWLVPVLGLSLVAAVFAYVAGIVAARALGAKVASFVGLSEVLFAVVFAWVLLDQVLAAEQLVGGLLVAAGITAVRIDELRAAQVAPAAPMPTVSALAENPSS